MKKTEEKVAAALKYDASLDDAPVLVGLGQGHVAQAMLQTAQENDVPIVEDTNVTLALSRLNLGSAIPEELYQAVAEILVFLARVDDQSGQKFGLERFQKS